jgi:acyl-CoA synthetase (AMP-forming)/AMP-acid ligase II/NAD(P)-dependent dehydrogenase (short-subunit alcohol dehydrogenase family)/acyl carrier protein
MFDFQGKQPSTSLSIDQLRSCLGAVETALMLEPTIKSAIVRLKKEQLVAYVVATSQIFDVAEIHRYLQNVIPLEWIPHIFIPLVTLPFNSLGELDELALANIPVIDDHLAAQWEDLIRQQPDIEKVAVVVSDRPNPTPPLHLADLLPNWSDSHRVHTPNRITPISHRLSDGIEIKSDRLAISHGEPLQLAPDNPLNLAEALKQAASKSPDKGIIYITDDGTESQQTYEELLTKAQTVMSGLRQLGLQPQDKVIFQLKDNSDFLAAFWGCILGGFIPVPLSVANSYQELNNNVKKLHSTWELLDRPVVLTNQNLVADIQSVAQLLAMIDLRIAEIESIRQGSRDSECHDSNPEDLAILLLTSGSTGNPKAVMQTHQSILKRSLATIQSNQFTSQDISLNWMPLDHVGGIIMFHIRDVCLACQQIHVATEFILGQPLRWLDLIDRFRATVTWAPNFAYGLINSHLESIHFDSNSPKTWDLSSMRFILNGGEAVVPKVARLFLQRLQSYGLSQTAMHPAWGMSETCSGVIYSDRFSIDSTSDRDAFVEVGDPVPEFSVRIVDQDGNLVLEAVTGIVQVQGSMVTKGYYGNLEANQEAFTTDGWFNTGDLGMLREGRLTITGRQKDTIIINGINYYSHEIEGVIEEIKGVAISFTAAIGARNGGDTDRLVIFFSPIYQDESAIIKLIQIIREQILQSSSIYPDYVIPVESTTIPKTAIGKIQRSLLKQQFEAGEFNHIIKKFDILEANSNTIPDWFFRKVWHRQELRPYVIPKTNRILLIFFDSLGLGESISQILTSEGQTCIKVEIGSEFTKFNSQHYAIAPNNTSHYRQLLSSLAKENLALTDILHLWTYDEVRGEISSVEELEQAQEYGLYSLLFLVQALGQETNQAPIKLRVVSSHAQAVLGNEAIAYAKSTILGLIKTISQENSWIESTHIDLTLASQTNPKNVIAELNNNSHDQEIAYREGHRWISRLEKINFPKQAKQELPFKQQGIYLLTGGLGGIGVEIAKYLLIQYQARLILVGKTSLPERSLWATHLQQNSPLSGKIKALQSLEQLTGEVIYEAVDICDTNAIQQIVNQSKTSWNCNLDGIIHLAGIYHEATLVEETQVQMSATLKPKVTGSWSLHQLLNDNPQAIFINFSSVAGFFSGAAIGAYASANSFLEGFSHYLHQKGIQSYCFAWSTWEETGISKGYQMKELIRARGYCSMLVQQGIESLIAALHHSQKQILIGLDRSSPYIRSYLHNEAIAIKHLKAYVTSQQPIEITELTKLSINDVYGFPSHCHFVQLDEMPLTDSGAIDYRQLASRDQRNQSDKKWILPRNAIEKQIARIWQEILNISQISVDDNFFEMGGQSLTATQVISRIREFLRVDLQLSTFFKMPTIASLADTLLKQSSSPTNLTKIAELRERLNQMSPEEVQSLLRAKQSTPE